ATQMAVCAVVILLASTFSPIPTALGRSAQPRWADGAGAVVLAWLVLVLSTLGFALPLLSVLIDGVAGGFGRVMGQASFWQATATSIGIGTASSVLTLLLALAL